MFYLGKSNKVENGNSHSVSSLHILLKNINNIREELLVPSLGAHLKNTLCDRSLIRNSFHKLTITEYQIKTDLGCQLYHCVQLQCCNQLFGHLHHWKLLYATKIHKAKWNTQQLSDTVTKYYEYHIDNAFYK